MSQEKPKMVEQMQKQMDEVQDATTRSMTTWNELLKASTDMAFDVVLKNWNYSRSLRGYAEQAVEDAIKTQHEYASEMMEVWQGYTSHVQGIVHQSVDNAMDSTSSMVQHATPETPQNGTTTRRRSTTTNSNGS